MTAYFIVAISLSILALIYIKIAKHFNILDKPNQRSSHTVPIIRGAGILFYIAVLFFFFFSGFKYPFFIFGLTIISIVSYTDDLLALSPKIRLVFQFLSIVLLLIQIQLLVEVPYILIPFLLITGVGFLNVYNFMDGINGITGLYTLVVLMALFYINTIENIIDQRIFLFVIISILVFGFFNFRKRARFFCGDIGSIALAVVLFFLVTFFSFKLKSPLFTLLVSVYLADAALTICYRKFLLDEKITEPHRHHIYQKLTDKLCFPHLKTSILYALLQSLISSIVLFSYKCSILIQLSLMMSVGLVLVIIYIYLFKWLDKK